MKSLMKKGLVLLAASLFVTGVFAADVAAPVAKKHEVVCHKCHTDKATHKKVCHEVSCKKHCDKMHKKAKKAAKEAAQSTSAPTAQAATPAQSAQKA